MVYDVAIDLAGAGRDHVPPAHSAAGGTAGPRRMPQRTAALAALDAQLPGRGPCPEERGVRRDQRAHGAGVFFGAGGANSAGWAGWSGLRRAELQDAEVHRGYRLAGGEPGATGGHEPAFAQRGAFGAGDVQEPGPDGELLAELEVAVVGLIAVGRDHGGVPGLVEDLDHLTQRVVVRADPVQAGHRPDLDHGRRGQVWAGAIHARQGERLGPGADHRQVDRVARGARAALAGGRDPGGGGPDRILGGHRCAHRGARGRPSPAVAMSSRWISLTPPPKVSTRLRLSWTSSQVIRAAVSGSASACRPTTSANDCPITCNCSEEKTLVADASATWTAAAAATCQLSSSLTRMTAAARASARRTSGWVSSDRSAAHARTRSCRTAIRPAGPSITRSWLSCVVISRQPSFSAPTRIRTGTRTPE